MYKYQLYLIFKEFKNFFIQYKMYRTYKDMGNSSEISKTSNKKFLKPYNSTYENIYENAQQQMVDTVDIGVANLSTDVAADDTQSQTEKYVPSCERKYLNSNENPYFSRKSVLPRKNRLTTVEKYNENNIIERSEEKIEHEDEIATNPEVWGPKAWEFLHTLTFSYPDDPTPQEQQSALNLFNSLPDMLPCKLCGDHCRENIIELPPQVQSKDSLSRWLVEFHNMVNEQTNEMNGTNKQPMTYEQAKQIYDGGVCFHSNK